MLDWHQEAESVTNKSDGTSAPQKKILVVEDDPPSMKLITAILESHGYRVLQATYAEEGILLAETEAPALVFMDISLPGIDGLAATKMLKQNPATRGIPVLAVTAHAMKGDEERALSAGCNGYLSKPITRVALLEIIEKHLSESRE